VDGRTAALQLRTLELGIRVVRLVQAFPVTAAGEVVAKQLVRAATAVGAGYRAACCAGSWREFSTRMSEVVADAERCVFWLALTRQTGMISGPAVADLHDEAQELAAVLTDALHSVTDRS
jgi:four helix bundle protein